MGVKGKCIKLLKTKAAKSGLKGQKKKQPRSHRRKKTGFQGGDGDIAFGAGAPPGRRCKTYVGGKGGRKNEFGK